jgi:hypothetical protein
MARNNVRVARHSGTIVKSQGWLALIATDLYQSNCSK